MFPVLVAGLSAWNIGRRALWIAAAVLVGGIALRVALWHFLVHSHDAYGPWYRYIYYPTYSRLDGLLVGVCVAATQSFSPRIWVHLTRKPSLLLTASGLLLLASFWIYEDRLGLLASAMSFPLIALAYGLIVIAAVSPRSALNRIHLRVTAFLAAVSYSLYLVHKIVIHVTQQTLSGMHLNIDGTPALLACTVTSLSAAWLFHIGVERPFMQLRSVILAHPLLAGR